MKLLTNTNKQPKFSFLAVFFSIMISASLSAQSSNMSFSGKVTDKDSKEAVKSAELLIKNTDPLIVAKTDENGNFKFENIPEGTYYLQLNHRKYNKNLVHKIDVSAGKNNFLVFEVSNKEVVKGKFKFKLKELLALVK